MGMQSMLRNGLCISYELHDNVNQPVRNDNQGRRSIEALESFRDRLDAAYGPCADERYTMSVEQGQGTLDELIAFATS